MAGVTFARDPATAAYYDRRAAEYDDWYLGAGLYAGRSRPGWDDEVAAVVELVGGLEPARTLDVACGTGFLTRHLRGLVVGLDQSPAMVAIAQHRLPDGLAIVGDSLALPFADDAFDRVFTGHFYGHLPPDERQAFLAEAARVAGEIVVVDSALRPGVEAEGFQERVLKDGSRHRVFQALPPGRRARGRAGWRAAAAGRVVRGRARDVRPRRAYAAARSGPTTASSTPERDAADQGRDDGGIETACRRCAPAPRSPPAAAAPCGTSGRWSSR